MAHVRYAAVGVIAALAGICAGHLVAGVTQPAASPVLAVGATVIDLTPTPVKELAVARFGTADKPILIGSVLLVTLVAAALIGIVARTHLWRGAALLGGLALLAGLAAGLRPTASAIDLLPPLATLVVGLGVLVALVRLARHTNHRSTVQPTEDGERPDRRVFLGASAAIVLLAIVAAAGGQARSGARAVRRLVLPRPAEPAPAFPAGLETRIPGVTHLRTSNETFYRVDTNLVVPQVDIERWTLEVDGMVQRPFTVTFAELVRMPLIERDITMTCVSNEVGGGYVSSARWLGVRVADLLARAGVRGRPDQVLSTAVDGFTISTPLAVLRDGRDAMVAVGMNGEPLPDVHGFPARLVTPGLYGFVGATKWLARLTLTTYAAQQAYWTRRQWATDAPVKTSARIDTPAPLSTVRSGRVVVGGVAWAQHRGISKVEVRIDDGPWRAALLGPDVGPDYWRQWYLPWNAVPGVHRLSVRATDLAGRPQPSVRATPFPDGASGIQEVVVTVE